MATAGTAAAPPAEPRPRLGALGNRGRTSEVWAGSAVSRRQGRGHGTAMAVPGVPVVPLSPGAAGPRSVSPWRLAAVLQLRAAALPLFSRSWRFFTHVCPDLFTLFFTLIALIYT